MKAFDFTGAPTPYETTVDKALKSLERAGDALYTIAQRLAALEAAMVYPRAAEYGQCLHFWDQPVQGAHGHLQRCVRCGLVKKVCGGGP